MIRIDGHVAMLSSPWRATVSAGKVVCNRVEEHCRPNSPLLRELISPLGEWPGIRLCPKIITVFAGKLGILGLYQVIPAIELGVIWPQKGMPRKWYIGLNGKQKEQNRMNYKKIFSIF